MILLIPISNVSAALGVIHLGDKKNWIGNPDLSDSLPRHLQGSLLTRHSQFPDVQTFGS